MLFRKFPLYLSALSLLVSADVFAKTKVDAKIDFLPRYYFEDIKKGTSQVDTPVIVQPSLSSKISPWLRFKLAPYLYADPVSKSVSENLLVDANEANAEIRMGDSSLALGLNQVSWGVTDVFNPLDVVSPRRYFDPLNSDKRGVPSVILTHESGDWRFEGLYIPVQLPSILPGNNSRWLPRDVTYNREAGLTKVILPDDLQYNYRDFNELDGSLHHNFGGRIEMRKSGVDLSAIFFQGAPTAPSIQPIAEGDLSWPGGVQTITFHRDVDLRPDYYWRRTVGASAVFTLSSSILRMEVANSDRVTGPKSVPGWSQSAVIGLEHNIPIAASTLTLLAQVTAARYEINADNTVTSIDRIFDQSGLLGFRLSTSDEWVYTAAVLRENVYKGTFLQAKAEKKITDGVSGQIQGEIIDAPGGTPLGSYTRNDRVGLGLTLFF